MGAQAGMLDLRGAEGAGDSLELLLVQREKRLRAAAAW